MRTSMSRSDLTEHEQRRIRLAQRERLQRGQAWQRLLHPYL